MAMMPDMKMPSMPGGIPGMDKVPGFGKSNAKEEVAKMDDEAKKKRCKATHCFYCATLMSVMQADDSSGHNPGYAMGEGDPCSNPD